MVEDYIAPTSPETHRSSLKSCAHNLFLTAVPMVGAVSADGVVTIQRQRQRRRLTVAVIHLPEASTLGDFDTYVAVVHTSQDVFHVPLHRVPTSGVLTVHAGAMILSARPALEKAFVRPINSHTNQTGPTVLHGVQVGGSPG